MKGTVVCTPGRLDDAAALLRTNKQCGPPALRNAVAAWLELNAATTRRIASEFGANGAKYAYTLPEVLAIVEAIEQA